MEKSAVAYRRGDFIFLRPESRTTKGFWISAPVVIKEDLRSVTSETLGKAVTRVLEGSAVGIPHPENWDEVTEPLLQLAGVKTWNTFERGAKCSAIERRGSVIVFTPNENRRREGFQSLDELKFEIPVTSTDTEIGEALLKAFELSK